MRVYYSDQCSIMMSNPTYMKQHKIHFTCTEADTGCHALLTIIDAGHLQGRITQPVNSKSMVGHDSHMRNVSEFGAVRRLDTVCPA